MLRFILLNVFIAVHTIIFCGFGLILSFFDGKKGRMVHSFAAVPWAKVILRACGVDVKVDGLENVDSTVARIYVTNHQSYFDIFALLAHLPVHFKFILKQELMNVPILGFGMRRAGYIGISRNNPREAVKGIKKAVATLKEGASVLIFPEGTRSMDGRLQPFKRGGFHLAMKSGCELVPILLTGSYKIVPKGSLKINRGTFAMKIGKPISVKNYAKKDMDSLMEQVRDAMTLQMKEGRR